MLNINRLNNSIDVGDDDMEQSLNEMDSESTTIGYMPILSQQPTSLSQLVVDDRSNQITNQRIDDPIAYEPRSRRSSIFVNESNTPIGGSRPWTQESIFGYVFAANRDEQSNNRITYPTDTVEHILINLLSPVVIRLIFDLIWNNIPLGIVDTQPHTLVLPVRVNTPLRDIIINNENVDINEDGTVFNDTDGLMNDENMNLTTNMIQHGDQMIVRESMTTVTTDDLTNNINSIVSTDAQGDNYLDINNQDERFMEYVHTSEIEHRDNLNGDNDERDQISPRPEYANDNEIRDNIQSSVPTAPILTSSVPTTLIIGSSEQPEEIKPLLAAPTDNNNHSIPDPAHLLTAGLDDKY